MKEQSNIVIEISCFLCFLCQDRWAETLRLDADILRNVLLFCYVSVLCAILGPLLYRISSSRGDTGLLMMYLLFFLDIFVASPKLFVML